MIYWFILISTSFPLLNNSPNFLKILFCIKLQHPSIYHNFIYTIISCDKHGTIWGPGKISRLRKSTRWIDEWLFMNDRMKKENARAYGSLRAYRRTFMAWKTCQSPLEASAENLSSDIPIHNTAMPPSSHMIFYISQHSLEFLFL